MKTGWRVKFFGILFLVCGIAFIAAADALENWLVRTSGTTNPIYAVTYGGSNFVVVGGAGVLLTSTNGSDWVSRSSGPPTDIYCASHGNGVFVAGGGPYGPTNVLVSTNAIDWLRLNAWNENDPEAIWGASYSGGLYFLLGSYGILLTASNIDVSCSGQLTNCNWSVGHAKIGELRGAAYGNGLYVVVGDEVSMVSTNAVVWTTHFTSRSFSDVAFGAGRFVAAGENGIYWSSNGVAWVQATLTTYLYRVAFGNGTFVAAGSNGRILTSEDGISWKVRPSPVTRTLNGVSYGNGTFIVTGAGGTILQSASVSVPSLTAANDAASGGIALALEGEIGRGYRIQVSTNMANLDWQDFLTFTNTGPTMEFLDTSVTNFSQRFYRAVSP